VGYDELADDHVREGEQDRSDLGTFRVDEAVVRGRFTVAKRCRLRPT
jgi:hypothetical protein